MAFEGGSYLPDIDKCLNGEALLLSWDDLLTPLFAHNFESTYPYSSTISDSKVKALLSNAIPDFPPSSPRARTSFDSKTAAIKISPTVSRDYNVEDIKSDALWLSKEVDLDEVEALRITLLEWQNRSDLCLKAGFSDAELASLKDALGISVRDSFGAGTGGMIHRSDLEFESIDCRKCRLVGLYHEEQLHLLSVSRQLIEIHVLKDLDEKTNIDVTTFGLEAAFQSESVQSLQKLINDGLNIVTQKLRDLNTPRQWSVLDDYQSVVNNKNTTCGLQAIATVLQILLLRLRRSKVVTPPETLLAWNEFLASVDYFAAFQSDIISQQSAISQIQSTAVSISLALLDAASVISTLVEDVNTESTPVLQQHYFTDLDVVVDINDFMLSAARSCNVLAGPGILSWSLILLELKRIAASTREARESHSVQRALDSATNLDHATGRRLSVSSSGSLAQSKFEEIIERVQSTSFLDDPIGYMLDCAVEGARAFDQICRLGLEVNQHPSVLNAFKQQTYQDLIAVSLPALGYSPDIVATQLIVLSHTEIWRSQPEIFQPDLNFLQDPFLLDNFLDVAAARFPYEALPFLRLCKSLARANVFDGDDTQYITFRLKRLDSFTQAAIKGFTSYNTIREDENANLVMLEQAVNLLDLTQNRSIMDKRHRHETLSVIPAETIGEVISESSPPIIKWQYQYSALELLGKWIELHYLGLLPTALSQSEDSDEVIVEVVHLLTAMLDSTFDHSKTTQNISNAREVCEAILAEISRGLADEADIASFVFDLIEQELQPLRRRTRNAYKCEVLRACVEFLIVLSKIRPVQVWSGIVRGSLFGTAGTNADLLSVVAAIGVPNQDFGLLEACSRLYDTLLDLALEAASPIKNHSPRSGNTSKPISYGASQRINSSALLSFTEVMVNIFVAIPGWTFGISDQRSRINSTIARAFCKLLRAGLGLGNIAGTVTSVNTIYLASAKHLTQALRLSDSTDTIPGPIVYCLASSLMDHNIQDRFEARDLPELQPILSLGALLLDSRQLLQQSIEWVEEQILNAYPIIIRLSILYPTNSSLCYVLARKALQRFEKTGTSSLLGHLGSVSAISFLESLKNTGKRSSATSTDCEIWNLLSRFVQQSQQWLAAVVLTRAAPGIVHKVQQPTIHHVRGHSLLTVALDSLMHIEALEHQTLIGILEFVIQAQQNWPLVTDAINSHRNFFSTIIRWLIHAEPSPHELGLAKRNMIAALIAQLATTHLHHIVASKDSTAVKTFIPLINWLTTNAVEVSSYNASLHANLKKNFAMKYEGVNIADFRRTELVKVQYGARYYYDIEFIDRLLDSDPYWRNEKAGNKGFNAEFERANDNLSVVDSEMVLLQSFKHMCLEHCAFFAKDREVQKTMAHAITKCMHANTQIYPSENLFETLFQSRADLAIILLQQLVAVGAKGSDFISLLGTVWNALRFRTGSYELAIMNNDLVYWRSMLSLLLMAMQFHVGKKMRATVPEAPAGFSISPIDSSNPLFLEITSSVIGEGLKSVVHSLNTKKHSRTVSPGTITAIEVGSKDVSLILNLLHTILRLPVLPQISAQVADRLISANVNRSCLLLYSWSHLLSGDGNDESVFAETSLRLLVCLSSFSPIAEEMAVEGIFNRILTAKVTQALQSLPGGVTNSRWRSLYGLWVDGLLPLCLNLLHSIGGGIAAEVSAFLNQFPAQLSRASLGFASNAETRASGGDLLSLSLATEVGTISLISFILQSFREAGASAGIDSQSILPLAGFDEHKKALAEDIKDVIQQSSIDRKRRTVALNQKEISWQKSSDNVLDNKILQQLRLANSCLQQEDEEGS